MSGATFPDSQLVDGINRQLAGLGMTYEELQFFLASQPPSPGQENQSDVSRAIGQIVKEQRVPDDKVAFRAAVRRLHELLRIEVSPQAFASSWNRLLKFLKTVVLTGLLVFCLYVVLGGIATGQSVLLGSLPVFVSLPILVLLLIMLAVVEGLEVSVLSLQLRRLDSVQAQYPRAFKTHEKLTSYENVDRFLSGRQAFVIFLVFLIAQLTSFPGMTTWPFTSVAFPSWMSPWFQTIFLRWGLLGALLAVWLGQLGPKLIANKNPLEYLNLPGMGFVCRLAMATESVGLTLPSTWTSQLFFVGRKRKDFPYSGEEEYRTKSTEYGYQVQRDYACLEFGSGFELDARKSARILDRVGEVQGAGFLSGPLAQSFVTTATLSDPDSSRATILTSEGGIQVSNVEGSEGTSFHAVVKGNGDAGFLPGQTVLLETKVGGPGGAALHRRYVAEVTSPTLLLEFRIRLDGGHQGSVTATMAKLGSRKQEHDIRIFAEGDSKVIHYVEWHPPIGSVHEVGWETGNTPNPVGPTNQR